MLELCARQRHDEIGRKLGAFLAKNVLAVRRVVGAFMRYQSRIKREGTMSDKDRQKKDGRDKNKKNQVMREANQNKTEKQARSQSNSTGQQSGGRK